MSAYKGKQISIKDGEAREVVPAPVLVELEDIDGNKETVEVKPSNPFYTTMQSYGRKVTG